MAPARRPLVSVVMTSYNHEEYVEEALESVLSQDVEDLELVVVDDGSSDSSPLKIGAYPDPRVRLIPLAINQGAAEALNLALRQARGDFIAVMSSDDAWLPGKLARQVEILADDAEIEAVFTDARLVRADGSDFPPDETPPYQGIFRQPDRTRGAWLRKFFESGNCLCHPSVLARKTLYDRLGFYDNRLRQLPDFDMWIRMCKVARIRVLDQELVRHRRVGTDGNVSSPTADNNARAFHEILWIGRTFFDSVSLEDLREGFADLMKNPEAESADELACEQALLLLTGPSVFASLFRLLGVEALHELLGRPQTRHLLAERYRITDVVLHELAATSRVLHSGFEHRWEAPSSTPPAEGEPPLRARPRSWLRCPIFEEDPDKTEPPHLPRLEVWAFCYNRRELLPYFLAHYRRFAQRIVVCDNRSTDGGREWLTAQGVEVLEDANGGSFDDIVLIEQKNALWKASRGRAEWVVVCDVDELVYISDLPRRLAWCVERGVAAVRLTGFNMVSERPPQHAGQIYDLPEFQVGAADPLWANKLAIFRPDMVDEINYAEGAHSAAPEGRGWIYGDDVQFSLLHYRFLGGVESFVARCADCGERLSRGNRKRRQSLHFLESEELIARRIAAAASTARNLFPPLY
jgi:glycosyltransferase involved in cell wall biosynthesis